MHVCPIAGTGAGRWADTHPVGIRVFTGDVCSSNHGAGGLPHHVVLDSPSDVHRVAADDGIRRNSYLVRQC